MKVCDRCGFMLPSVRWLCGKLLCVGCYLGEPVPVRPKPEHTQKWADDGVITHRRRPLPTTCLTGGTS